MPNPVTPTWTPRPAVGTTASSGTPAGLLLAVLNAQNSSTTTATVWTSRPAVNATTWTARS